MTINNTVPSIRRSTVVIAFISLLLVWLGAELANAAHEETKPSSTVGIDDSPVEGDDDDEALMAAVEAKGATKKSCGCSKNKQKQEEPHDRDATCPHARRQSKYSHTSEIKEEENPEVEEGHDHHHHHHHHHEDGDDDYHHTCPHAHHHHHDDDDEHDHEHHHHDHDDEGTVGDWIAKIRNKETGEVVKEVHLLMERHGVVRLDVNNFYTAMQLMEPWQDASASTAGTQVFVVYWYSTGCGLCMDAHDAFVETARHFRDALTKQKVKSNVNPKDEKVALRPAQDASLPIRFGQFEVDFDNDDVANHVKSLGPKGAQMQNDFPLITIMWRQHKVNVPQQVAITRKEGFTGNLTSDGIAEFLAVNKIGRGQLDDEVLKLKLDATSKVKLGESVEHPEGADGDQGKEEERQVFSFTDGLLDVDE